MTTLYQTHRTEAGIDKLAASQVGKPKSEGLFVLHPKNSAQLRNDILTTLETSGLLNDKELCLQLVAALTERVGYLCAGYTSTSTVTELMAMSARASALAEQLSENDQT